MPILTVLPSPTPRPATLNLEGDGYAPGQWVRVQLDGKSTSPITRFPIDRDGVFAVGIKVPSSIVVGQHSVRVTTDSSSGTVLATANYVVQVAAPPPPPAAGAVISNIVATPNPTGASVAWDVAPASQGQVEYGPTTAYGSLSTRETSYAYTHHVQGFPLPAGTYHFRVRGSAPGQTSDSLSPDGTFIVAATAPPPPVITPPPVVTPPPGTAPADTVMFTVPPSTQSDMRAQIQSFIEAQRNAGKTAGFEGVYRWDSRMVLSGSGIRIWLGPTAQFRRTVHGNGVRSMFSPNKADGISVIGSNQLHFVGPATVADVSRKDDAYPGEDEYLIEHYGGKGATYRGIKASGFWSDGMYIVRFDDNATGTEPDGVTVEDCEFTAMGRNIISVIAGRNLVFRRVIGSISRLHGFDLEPNRDSDVFVNALFEDCSFTKFDQGLTASGRGHAVVIGGAPGRVQATNVKIIRQRSDVGVKGGTLYVVGPSNGQHHDVTVTGWRTGAGGSGQVSRVSNWQQSDNEISLPASGNVG